MRFNLRLLPALLAAVAMTLATAVPAMADAGNETEPSSGFTTTEPYETHDSEDPKDNASQEDHESDDDNRTRSSSEDSRDEHDENETRDDSEDDEDDGNATRHDSEDDETEDGDDEDGRDELEGDYVLSGNSVDGRNVDFTLTADGVLNYTVDGVRVFDAIRFDPSLDAREVKAEHGEFKAEGEETSFKAVDTPNGHFKAEAAEGLRLSLASGWTANAPSNQSSDDRLRLDGPDGRVAYLNGEDGIMLLDNRTVEAPEEVRFVLHAPGRTNELSPEIDEAIEDGRVAGEVIVREGHAITIEHGDVNMTVVQENGAIEIEVEGEGAGKTFVFTVGAGTLGSLDNLEVSFDGAPIGRADDMADILDARADEPAEYLIVVGANATQVLVQVPHFSVHTIQLQSAATSAQGLTGSLAAFIAAAVVAVAFIAVTIVVRARHR